MATKTITMNFPESTSRSRSQTQNIQDIGEPITLSVDTGSASYSISGRDLTVNVSNGIAVGSGIEYKYDASGYLTDANPSNFPSTYSYNDGTYTGNLPKSGSVYQSGFIPSDAKNVSWDWVATLTWRFKWSGTSWSFDSGSPGASRVDPPTQTYSDADGYVGTLDYSSWNGSTPDYPPNSAGAGQDAGYTTTRSINGSATYYGTAFREAKTLYRQDYYGTAQRNVNYYTYNVTVTYTSIPRRPIDFSWNTSKVSGGNFNLTASEWNGLCNKVNEFRVYKNYNEATFTIAYSNSDFLASMFNEVRNATAVLSASVPSTKSKGDDINASDLNQLVSALNSVT